MFVAALNKKRVVCSPHVRRRSLAISFPQEWEVELQWSLLPHRRVCVSASMMTMLLLLLLLMRRKLLMVSDVGEGHQMAEKGHQMAENHCPDRKMMTTMMIL